MNKFIIPAACALAALVGCSTATPASRATTVQYTFNYDFGKGARNVTINNKTGDGAISSADSSGSTETQTATPTVDVRPDIDVHYNDAVGTGGNAISAFVSSLTSESAALLRDYVVNKKSGKITVTTKDGTTETLNCDSGTCTTTGGLKINASNCENCVVK